MILMNSIGSVAGGYLGKSATQSFLGCVSDITCGVTGDEKSARSMIGFSWLQSCRALHAGGLGGDTS